MEYDFEAFALVALEDASCDFAAFVLVAFADVA
jgi:hypothetical protein